MSSKPKQTNSSDDPAGTFTPIKDSACSPFSSHGNLTGVPRKLKDTAADLHNCVAKWKVKKQAGYAVLNKIANIKVAALEEAATGGTAGCLLPETLLPLCEEITSICCYLEKQVNKMAVAASALRGLCALREHDIKVAESPEPQLAVAWPISHYADCCEHLLACYSEELLAKHNIAHNLAHVRDRSTAMFMLSCWLYEPFVDDECSLLLEAMLVETGHR